MSIYSAEDPEGRTTDTAAWRDHLDAEAHDAEAHDAEAHDAEARDTEAHDAEARDGEARDGEARDDADEAAAAGARSEPSTANGDEAADPDVIVLEEADVVVLDEEPRDSGTYASAAGTDPGLASDQDREFSRADVAADTGPELASAGVPGAGAEPTNAGATGTGPDDQGAPAVAEPAARTGQLQERWLAIQSDFVDDPRRSVTSAAALVAEAIDTLVAEIRERDASLRETWDSSDADTEVLRNALRDYRSFLDRLVAQ